MNKKILHPGYSVINFHTKISIFDYGNEYLNCTFRAHQQAPKIDAFFCIPGTFSWNPDPIVKIAREDLWQKFRTLHEKLRGFNTTLAF